MNKPFSASIYELFPVSNVSGIAFPLLYNQINTDRYSNRTLSFCNKNFQLKKTKYFTPKQQLKSSHTFRIIVILFEGKFTLPVPVSVSGCGWNLFPVIGFTIVCPGMHSLQATIHHHHLSATLFDQHLSRASIDRVVRRRLHGVNRSELLPAHLARMVQHAWFIWATYIQRAYARQVTQRAELHRQG